MAVRIKECWKRSTSFFPSRGRRRSSFPVTASGGDVSIVAGLEISEFSQDRINTSVAELIAERDAVHEQGLI